MIIMYNYMYRILRKTKILNLLGDETAIKLTFKYRLGYKLNLKNPKTFNEKLQWLKLNDRKDIYSIMVDKYEVKKYVSKLIGEEYMIPTIGVYNDFDEINFNNLPNKFVIKCTHDSGGLEIVKDKAKLNLETVKQKIVKSLKTNYYYNGREWPYKNVKPRIIIEKYMEDYKTKELRDYKFFCFNGNVKYFKIDFNRATYHQANYFNRNGLIQKFGEEICPPDFNKKLEMPKNLKLMINLAEKISNQNKFLRVDFYEIDDKIYFGEITFYPAAGFGKFVPKEWDSKLGELINLK